MCCSGQTWLQAAGVGTEVNVNHTLGNDRMSCMIVCLGKEVANAQYNGHMRTEDSLVHTPPFGIYITHAQSAWETDYLDVSQLCQSELNPDVVGSLVLDY